MLEVVVPKLEVVAGLTRTTREGAATSVEAPLSGRQVSAGSTVAGPAGWLTSGRTVVAAVTAGAWIALERQPHQVAPADARPATLDPGATSAPNPGARSMWSSSPAGAAVRDATAARQGAWLAGVVTPWRVVVVVAAVEVAPWAGRSEEGRRVGGWSVEPLAVGWLRAGGSLGVGLRPDLRAADPGKGRYLQRKHEGCYPRATDQQQWTVIDKYKITRGHNYTLVKKQSRLDVRKYSFSQRTINVWNKLSTDCVHASSVNMFKNKIDKYLAKAGYT